MNLLFIGAINKGNIPKGGEEYKNQLLIDKIKSFHFQARIIDTYQWTKNPKIWWNLFENLCFNKVDSVLISASSVSTYRLLGIIQCIKPSLLPKITYLVIGGYFPEGIQTKRFNWERYKNLKSIIVQGETLRQTLLKNTQLTNVKVIPNFKTLPNLNLGNKDKCKDKVQFVFVGRISEGKGVKEILEAVEILNRLDEKFQVDFYGQVEGKFDLETNNTKYCGFLDFQKEPENAYVKLSEYDCMLFPTCWKGEGFPGVIIDAFIAGLPIIATDWNMNTEIIEEGINGFIIEPKNSKALADMMKYVMAHREGLKKIRENNLNRAKNYHIDIIWPHIEALL